MNLSRLRHLLSEAERDLLTSGQIADRTGAKIDTVGFWSDKPDFPKPMLRISSWRGQGVRVWHADEVAEWLEATERFEYLRSFRTSY